MAPVGAHVREATIAAAGFDSNSRVRRARARRFRAKKPARTKRHAHRSQKTMATRIAINGFGRIGRLVFRALYTQGRFGKDIEVVAVGDIVPADNLAYLLKYDSIQGKFEGQVGSKKSVARQGRGRRAGGRRQGDQGGQRQEPGRAALEGPRRRHRDRVDRPVRRQGEVRGPHQGRRQEGDHLRPGQERGHHHRLRRQPREVRPGQAPRRLQRQLHHQLPGAGGARAAQGGLRPRPRAS